MKRSPLTTLRYALEALVLLILLGVFRILGPDKASAFGGWLGRNIGPRLATSRKARRNLERAITDLSEARKDEIIKGMWNNLGRVIGEYPHLETLSRDHTTIVDTHNLKAALKDPNGAIFISAHIGNWEISISSVYTQFNRAVDPTYRAPNNPWSDRLLTKARTLNGKLTAHPKSRSGGRAIMNALKNKGLIGMLVDQKYNEGIEVPFFGRPAMTNDFFITLAQKYKCTLIPARNKRINGSRFENIVYPPISVFDNNDEPRSAEDILAEIHDMMEDWIRETPEQWLWLHRRWKD